MPNTKSSYSPKISEQSYQILQRLAWFDNVPMTKALEAVIYQSLELVNLDMVCHSCRASRSDCSSCIIKSKL